MRAGTGNKDFFLSGLKSEMHFKCILRGRELGNWRKCHYEIRTMSLSSNLLFFFNKKRVKVKEQKLRNLEDLTKVTLLIQKLSLSLISNLLVLINKQCTG